MSKNYTEEQLAFIIHKKEVGKRSFEEIAAAYNKKFDDDLGERDVQLIYNKNKNILKQGDNHIRTLKAIHRTKKTNSYTAKENRIILEEWNRRDDLIDEIKLAIKDISKNKHKIPKIKKSRKKKNMTLELLFSDVHYGKKIDNIEGNYVDLEEIRKRVRKVSESVVKEIAREGKSFNVERVVLAVIGDIIENADFHGMESTRACEFSTARQVSEAIKSIYLDLILPIAQTGVKVDVPCVTGNHDRNGKDKTYQKPGEQNHTHTIYTTLELLCKQAGLTNVTFDICLGLYTSVDVYGNTIVYEHGDELRGMNRDTMANMMSKRQTQLNKVVHFYRIGHFHEPTIYGQGRMIVNGSVPGQDEYAHSKGFSSEACQILNYYVETEKRSTCFFRSFPIYLQNKEDEESK